ncbi:phytanoyl-CoA dioxygenase family protein [Dactylosporangium cerinum]
MSAIAAAPDNGTATWAPMTREQREQFDADGYLVLKGVLSPDEVRHYASVLETAHRQHPAPRTARCTCSARSRTTRTWST